VDSLSVCMWVFVKVKTLTESICMEADEVVGAWISLWICALCYDHGSWWSCCYQTQTFLFIVKNIEYMFFWKKITFFHILLTKIALVLLSFLHLSFNIVVLLWLNLNSDARVERDLNFELFYHLKNVGFTLEVLKYNLQEGQIPNNSTTEFRLHNFG
jgi:hypothetical protein